MEQDKQLKEILLKNAEIASANFTEAIMKRVNKLSANTFYYQPLVSSVLVFLILVLCLAAELANISFINRIKIPQIPVLIFYKVLIFIILFWVVFTINAIIYRKRLKLY